MLSYICSVDNLTNGILMIDGRMSREILPGYSLEASPKSTQPQSAAQLRFI